MHIAGITTSTQPKMCASQPSQPPGPSAFLRRQICVSRYVPPLCRSKLRIHPIPSLLSTLHSRLRHLNSEQEQGDPAISLASNRSNHGLVKWHFSVSGSFANRPIFNILATSLQRDTAFV
ncbi:hypothetical protein MPTK1_1g12570 [Marchantia polymorpha subsp. ruderalis]|uniref:Uncharacterized protein n=2 Tax=Marchantia polymorpha TaxID=3197 RepID=A0AAF6APE9_MARPO|nr:hypothetical protein MARPO_0019s0027 [Marchantia polymorpha]BBM98319.1 hypothetical protein Mp_1g12570 [Marchantia polymorpha subsp. ruderalis]|eukprot:PTQ44586.1 hypothetical protein MARPO_0019s0027 [Marchantia polymorpha]